MKTKAYLRDLWSGAYLSIVVWPLAFASAVSAAVNPVHISACGVLSQQNASYILDNDISAPGTCLVIT